MSPTPSSADPFDRGRTPFVVFMIVLGCFTACGGHDSDDRPPPATTAADATARHDTPTVTVTLPGEPAASYRAGGEGPATGALASRIETRIPGLKVIPCLERAAGIYGRTAQADRLPLSFSEFALHWSGCPDPFAAVLHVLTDDDGEAAVIDQMIETLESIPATHVGVARVPASEPYSWRWTVFLVERRVVMQSVPSMVSPGSSVALVVRFLEPVEGASVITTHPNGSVVEAAAGLSGDRMLAAVEIADRPGTQWIEVVAVDATGPHVVLLFPVEVGREPPRAWVGTRRQDEGWIGDDATAADFAFELLTKDRVRFGLHSLARDGTLDEVARRHSEEMALTGMVAHVSATTGSVVDRLGSVGYEAGFAAENLARASTITDAHDGLMRSPGHRAAILSSDATRVGVGVATIEGPETGKVHFVTQIIARPLGVE
jgi:uncharacterized protein YkwD